MICYVDRLFVRSIVSFLIAAVAIAAAGCGGGIQSGGQATELVNPFLGPAYSQWLVGPISRMATAEEMDAFLALQDDATAVQFIEDFWARRDTAPAIPDNPLRKSFETRAAEADRRYEEGGYPGRRTDRGITYVLFGEPEKTDYEISPNPSDPPIEVWFYPAGAEAGLSGERPAPKYRFIKRDDLTSFYVPRSLDDPRGRTPNIDRF